MENKLNTKEKIIKLSKVMSTIFKVVSSLCMIAVIGCLVGMIIVGTVAWDRLEGWLVSASFGEAYLEKIKSLNLASCEIQMADGLLESGFSMIATYFLYKMFGFIVENETPFNDKTVSYLNKIAIVMIVSALGRPAIIGGIVGIINLCGGNVIYEALNPGNIIISLILFAVSLIFKYGIELQKENDATL